MSYVSRKSYVYINNVKICLNEFYDKFSLEKVKYEMFRQRIKMYEKRYSITHSVMDDAITLSTNEWISFYGGGKRKAFIYQGKYFKECINIEFPSLSAFLRVIGEYDRHILITKRIHNKWDIDTAIFRETVDTSLGRIYAIKCKLNDLIYVGQTITERLAEHIMLYNKQKSSTKVKLYKAFNDYGIDNFYIEMLEDNIDNRHLKDRENWWITLLNSIYSVNGLNMIPANRSPAGYGKETRYQGKVYKSAKSAIRELQKENPGCPEYIIERRVKRDAPIPTHPRHRSYHPDAGSNLYRRWKSLKRLNKLCEYWATDDDTGYERFRLNGHRKI